MTSERCALVYNGNVVNIIMADPATDEVEGMQVVASSDAEVGWAYAGGVFTGPAPVPATPDELLNEKIKAGIQIISTGTPALNSTYSLEASAQQLIIGVCVTIASGRGLPGGQSTLPLADVNGDPHPFTATNVQDLAQAMGDYMYSLYTQRSILKAGGQANWPAQPVTIP